MCRVKLLLPAGVTYMLIFKAFPTGVGLCAMSLQNHDSIMMRKRTSENRFVGYVLGYVWGFFLYVITLGQYWVGRYRACEHQDYFSLSMYTGNKNSVFLYFVFRLFYFICLNMNSDKRMFSKILLFQTSILKYCVFQTSILKYCVFQTCILKYCCVFQTNI